MIKKIFFAALLLVCAQVAMAEKVLYAQVEGTNMILKYGEKPDDSGAIKYYQFNGTAGWNATFYGTITTATVDASCASFDGNSTKSLFDGFSALTDINDIDNLNTAKVEDMYNMFANCSSLTTLDLHTFNTAKVTNMAMMFYRCYGLTSLRVGSWNTANVTDMRQMFQECSSLAKLNLSEWNTAKVTSMLSMFQGCSNLVTIYVGPEWNTDAVTSDELMFSGCSNIRGRAGTTYAPSKLDKTYARIDEGGEKSGYMSGGTLIENMSGGYLTTNLAKGRRWVTWFSHKTYVIDEEEDADAYAAVYDSENSCLILTKIGDGKIIPGNMAVIVVADKDNEYIIMTFDDTVSVPWPDNDLTGCYSDMYVNDVLSMEFGDNGSWGALYVMGMVDSNFGFYKYTGDIMPAYKAYLPIEQNSDGSARAITLSFADDITGVKTVSGDNVQSSMFNGQSSDVWYTINGVKLSGKPTAPGMYINNGKKILIK